MKVCIAGSRTIRDYALVEKCIKDSGFVITEVVSGGALGVDQLGEIYANYNGLPVKLFLPDWQAFGKRAGMIRNEQMARYADAVIIVWDGVSKGSLGMMEICRKMGRKFYLVTAHVIGNNESGKWARNKYYHFRGQNVGNEQDGSGEVDVGAGGGSSGPVSD